jgi:GNAT superfamily N-acetyltransferase
MSSLPPGWATDLAVLEHTGSVIEDHGDHLVIRSPQNPGFHWGNFLLVIDPITVDDARRWVEAFGAAFPQAGWVAIGLARMPRAGDVWAEHGMEVELDEVLATRTLPRQTDLPGGYTVRQLTADDWEQSVRRALADNDATKEHEPQVHERFVRARAETQQTLCERDVAAFFGAFADDVLVADLGIVRCGATARYQNVGTHAAHRRRGLASHLLGVAARWAGDRGCDEWVIVTEATNSAGRVYRSVGFELGDANASAYRPPR